MATASSSGGQHHASLNLMACVRESSPQQDDLVSDATDADLVRHGKFRDEMSSGSQLALSVSDQQRHEF
jgi:hypothetical protein